MVLGNLLGGSDKSLQEVEEDIKQQKQKRQMKRGKKQFKNLKRKKQQELTEERLKNTRAAEALDVIGEVAGNLSEAAERLDNDGERDAPINRSEQEQERRRVGIEQELDRAEKSSGASLTGTLSEDMEDIIK